MAGNGGDPNADRVGEVLGRAERLVRGDGDADAGDGDNAGNG